MKIILFLIANLFFSGLSASSGQGEIKMVFRYDDYLLIPSKLSDSLMYIFRKNNIPLCLGTIPFDSSGSFINKLNPDELNDLRSRIQRNEIEVALHGWNHINELRPPFLGKISYSEFASLDYEKQYKKLATGKKVLDSVLQINTRVYIPTFNTYDNNTLTALEDLKFEVISGVLKGVTSKSNTLKYIPATYEDFSELPEIVENSKGSDVSIIIYFHPYSFRESSSGSTKDLSKLITISQLDTLLNWIKKQNVSFYTFSDLAKRENFDETGFQANSLRYNMLKKILNKLRIYRYGVYSNMEFQNRNILLIIGNIILHVLSFLFVYFLVCFIIKFLSPSLKKILIFLAICSVTLFVYLIYIRNDFSFEIILIIVLVNVIALVSGILRMYKSPIPYSGTKRSGL
jgi:peptidoglycan/xylan/chitin deacetylase (PgdA/CDA1 family)